jgi:spore germination protein
LGDTLSSIAKKFGVSVNAIIDANSISNPNRIYLGQELVIPSNDYRYYIVEMGDTLTDIAERFGCTVDDIVRWNELILAGDSIRVG